MGPKQLGTWNKVSAPSQMTEGMQDNKVVGSGFAGSARVASKEEPQREEQAGGMKSAQTSETMNAAGSGRTSLKSPPAEAMPKGLMDGGKY